MSDGKNPDEIVAEKIFKRILDEKKLDEKDLKKIENKFSNGSMDVGDWNLLAESKIMNKEG